MEKLVRVINVGKLTYSKGLVLQKYLANLHNTSTEIKNTLLCIEHPPVYTTGIRHKQYTESQVEKLKETGADFFRTNRGGLITFHGPGQLVVYPILNLKYFKPSIRWYVCSVEDTVIKLCEHFNLKGEKSPHTGVWIQDRKLCAIGVHGSRFITTHGLALNCSTDLSWFDHIVPCGIEGKGVTSLSQELGRTVTIEETIPKFLECFKNTFDCDTVEVSKQEVEIILSNIDK
ncbi:putative lipoyltransferase 2, mitochondrial [Diorhabda carinulata]|uniref:putative lipoyltransferase 2, mitochondrial n=1 Tax=Diorhabda carinulata TaxID=1163345 RepID=UPI0025A064E1|nr:putative lipoyltransferase 2, mitochondrial [Diorhabda carinulata]